MTDRTIRECRKLEPRPVKFHPSATLRDWWHRASHRGRSSNKMRFEDRRVGPSGFSRDLGYRRNREERRSMRPLQWSGEVPTALLCVAASFDENRLKGLKRRKSGPCELEPMGSSRPRGVDGMSGHRWRGGQVPTAEEKSKHCFDERIGTGHLLQRQ